MRQFKLLSHFFFFFLFCVVQIGAHLWIELAQRQALKLDEKWNRHQVTSRFYLTASSKVVSLCDTLCAVSFRGSSSENDVGNNNNKNANYTGNKQKEERERRARSDTLKSSCNNLPVYLCHSCSLVLSSFLFGKRIAVRWKNPTQTGRMLINSESCYRLQSRENIGFFSPILSRPLTSLGRRQQTISLGD